MSGPTDEAYANGRRAGESWAAVRLVKLERDVEAFKQECAEWREMAVDRIANLEEDERALDVKDSRIHQLLVERDHFHDAFKREVEKRKALEAEVQNLRVLRPRST